MDITVHKFSGQPNIATTANQIHLHSTGNPKATIENEVKYLVDNGGHKNAFYTHIVGQGKVYQVANTGRGAWDVGGGWNHNTYAAIEFSELVNSKAEFEQSYKLYIALARQLAKQGGIAMQYNTGSKGLMTHDYCSKHQPANKSDHVDPMPFLNKWGISEAQFKKDLLNGIDGEVTFTNVATTSAPAASAAKTSTGSIATVQSWLNSNYGTGLAVDNLNGPATKRALAKGIQTEINRQFGGHIAVDGIFGSGSKSAFKTIRRGAQGNMTRIIQGAMICKGYSVNGFDGIFGGGLQSAVKQFQSVTGLSSDGVVGPDTAYKLFA
jgi:peptidoglycan hydrolase-like protein with peptidoglycan-binding domain